MDEIHHHRRHIRLPRKRHVIHRKARTSTSRAAENQPGYSYHLIHPWPPGHGRQPLRSVPPINPICSPSFFLSTPPLPPPVFISSYVHCHHYHLSELRNCVRVEVDVLDSVYSAHGLCEVKQHWTWTVLVFTFVSIQLKTLLFSVSLKTRQ